jgi:predicted phosphodiesterase
MFSRKKNQNDHVDPSAGPAPGPRVAILGDIHANLEALEAVLADIRGQGVSQIVCTGDIVGYAADPVACLERLCALNIPAVRGNHDHYAAGDIPLDPFNMQAMIAMRWTRDQLSAKHKKWLAGLPLTLGFDLFTLVHSSFPDPDRWRYVYNEISAAGSLAFQNVPLAFYGHTHVPMAFEQDEAGEVSGGPFKSIELEPGKKYFINVGSVGQPRDRDRRAAYGLFDATAQTVEIRRVEYDVAEARRKIEAAGLPLRNAERLSQGW